MDRRNDDAKYQMHEQKPPAGEPDERLSAREHEQHALEQENSPAAIQQRQNTNRPAPSEVRRQQEDS
jgi:hypothetical protein